MERLSPAAAPTATAAPKQTAVPSDWPDKAADAIESAIGLVRDKSVRPLTLVAKAAVYGLIVAIVGVSVAVMVAVGVVRLLNVYALTDWESDVVVGGILALVGMFALSRAWAARRR